MDLGAQKPVLLYAAHQWQSSRAAQAALALARLHWLCSCRPLPPVAAAATTTFSSAAAGAEGGTYHDAQPFGSSGPTQHCEYESSCLKHLSGSQQVAPEPGVHASNTSL